MKNRPTPEEIAYEVAWHRKLGARTQASFANAIRAEREHYERTHVSKARVREVLRDEFEEARILDLSGCGSVNAVAKKLRIDLDEPTPSDETRG